MICYPLASSVFYRIVQNYSVVGDGVSHWFDYSFMSIYIYSKIDVNWH